MHSSSRSPSTSEVHVVKRRRVSSTVRSKFRWTIDDFLQLPNDVRVTSDHFHTHGTKWAIVLDPDGKGPVHRGFVSAFLKYCGHYPLRVTYTLRVVNQQHAFNSVSKSYDHTFGNGGETSWGCFKLLDNGNLIDRGFLTQDGCLVVEADLRFEAATFTAPAIPPPPSTLMKDLGSLLTSGAHSDVEIRGDGPYSKPVHRVILCIRSPVFQAMFHSDMKESNEGVVEIHGIRESVMNAMLAWMYHDETPDDSVAQDLIVAADRYQMPDLVKLCASVLSKSLSLHNVVNMIKFAKVQPQCTALLDACECYLAQHIDEALASDTFLTLMEASPDVAQRVVKRTRQSVENSEKQHAASSHGPSHSPLSSLDNNEGPGAGGTFPGPVSGTASSSSHSSLGGFNFQ